MDSREQRLEKLRHCVDLWVGDRPLSDELTAMIETAFLMAVADGQMSSEEHEQLAATVQHIVADKVGADPVQTIIERLSESLNADGWEGRIAAVARALSAPETRRDAYRLAAGVSFIDGEVQDAEARLFGLLSQAFEIPSDEASKILTEVRDEMFAPTPSVAKDSAEKDFASFDSEDSGESAESTQLFSKEEKAPET